VSVSPWLSLSEASQRPEDVAAFADVMGEGVEENWETCDKRVMFDYRSGFRAWKFLEKVQRSDLGGGMTLESIPAVSWDADRVSLPGGKQSL
jgi:hypothetical protein